MMGRQLMGLLSIGCFGVAIAACVGDGDTTIELDEGRTDSVSQAEEVDCPVAHAAVANAIQYDKSLMIRDTAVVDDPCRTNFNPSLVTCPNTSINGKWSFWYLMTKLAGTNNTSKFVLKWLESFEETPAVNGQALLARPKVRQLIIDAWRQKSGCATGVKYDASPCTLDPTKAPFRLLAIVSRVDLRVGGAGTPGSIVNGPYGQVVVQGSGGDAGEARFVFGFTDLNSIDSITQAPNPIEATVIFEYRVPTQTRAAVDWAKDWQALSSFPSFNASYSAALQTITDRFTNSGVTTNNPNNGNALSQLRTDELAFDPKTIASQKVWSMREFKLDCLPGQSCGTNDKFLINKTTAQTPRNEFNETATLDTFLTVNQGASVALNTILNGSHVVPATFDGAPFLGGDSRSPSAAAGPLQWNRTDPNAYMDPNVCTARRLFAFSTCNGCHYLETDNTGNLHIKNRKKGNSSVLSQFLTGQQVVSSNDPCEDPNTGATTYNEPARRKCELAALVNKADQPIFTTTGRVH